MVQADTIDLINGGIIVSSSAGLGNPGNLSIIVNNKLSMSGRRPSPYITLTGIQFDDLQSGINSFSLFGTGGNISILSPNIMIDNEGLISASSLGLAGIMTGDSGSITINTENISITNGGLIDNSNGVFIGSTFFSGPESGGDIKVNAENITIFGSSLDTGIASNSYTEGHGGNIKIQTGNLDINDSGAISAHSYGTGNAGQINIQANTINLTNQGNISTEAENSAGGNISIDTPNLLYLHKGEITTSVGAGEKKGGDIAIASPNFIILNKGQIKAQADKGYGGNISIQSEQFITSPNSIISASSNLGLDGEIEIDSLNLDMEGFLMTLPEEVVEASNLMKRPCSMQGSSFTVNKLNGSPPTPHDYQSAQYLPKTKITIFNAKEKLIFFNNGCKLKSFTD